MAAARSSAADKLVNQLADGELTVNDLGECDGDVAQLRLAAAQVSHGHQPLRGKLGVWSCWNQAKDTTWSGNDGMHGVVGRRFVNPLLEPCFAGRAEQLLTLVLRQVLPGDRAPVEAHDVDDDVARVRLLLPVQWEAGCTVTVGDGVYELEAGHEYVVNHTLPAHFANHSDLPLWVWLADELVSNDVAGRVKKANAVKPLS